MPIGSSFSSVRAGILTRTLPKTEKERTAALYRAPLGATIGQLPMLIAAKRMFLLLSTVTFLLPCSARAQVQAPFYGPLPVFEFHSGFWVNLHHELYFEAKQRENKSAPPAKGALGTPTDAKTMRDSSTPLTPAEQSAWDAAVNYYLANYADKDLLFNNDLILLKNQLGDFEDCDELSGAHKKTCDAGLPGRITDVLDSAAPIYRAHLWPDHDRANRRWTTRVAPLVEEQGAGISQRLADIYQAKWPNYKIRVDVSAHANWAGAYTTLDPLRVTISSTDPANQGNAALEVLFHEASHGLAEPVQAAIARECRQRDKPIPRDLWHALIFYTTGEVVKPLLSADAAPPKNNQSSSSAHPDRPPANNDEYIPYAIRQGLYQRGWNDYLELLTRFWQPYLDGRATFDDAIARMVSSL
jgi:hypothetical protein